MIKEYITFVLNCYPNAFSKMRWNSKYINSGIITFEGYEIFPFPSRTFNDVTMSPHPIGFGRSEKSAWKNAKCRILTRIQEGLEQ